ncbi:hypothetical protein [Lactiplantibacillus pingfangensis]|uniref:hypothetical protein n=1 Tax=Lactiplantibacillus pingfangensis TaxID=2559915 RepID=UPI0010F7962D|nr:hypothetical protein [Lactiplantibacillus pingfangensis]
MKQFWSLALMILAGCLLILGSEYSLQGDSHRYRHQVTATMTYDAANETATIHGRTKHGVIVTTKAGKNVRHVISNKQNGLFAVKLVVKNEPRVLVQVTGLKEKVLKVPVASKR